METLLKEKPHKRLGFAGLETAEIVNKLNTVLANYQMFFHKLQNYHWNVVGSDFYDIHETTEELYTKGLTNIDSIAERVRVFGKTPLYRLSEYIEISEIKETTHELSAEYMVNELITDITTLTSFILEASEIASENGDIGTAHMMNNLILEFETYHWQLSAWNNKKFK